MTAARPAKPSRLERALAIRDHVLPLVRQHGTPNRLDETRFLVWDTGPWRFSFGLDGLPPPQIAKGDPFAYQAAVLLQDLQEKRGGLNLDHALDIWRGPKVFLAEWNAETPDRLNIATFKRGEWEIALLAFVGDRGGEKPT